MSNKALPPEKLEKLVKLGVYIIHNIDRYNFLGENFPLKAFPEETQIEFLDNLVKISLESIDDISNNKQSQYLLKEKSDSEKFDEYEITKDIIDNLASVLLKYEYYEKIAELSIHFSDKENNTHSDYLFEYVLTGIIREKDKPIIPEQMAIGLHDSFPGLDALKSGGLKNKAKEIGTEKIRQGDTEGIKYLEFALKKPKEISEEDIIAGISTAWSNRNYENVIDLYRYFSIKIPRENIKALIERSPEKTKEILEHIEEKGNMIGKKELKEIADSLFKKALNKWESNGCDRCKAALEIYNRCENSITKKEYEEKGKILIKKYQTDKFPLRAYAIARLAFGYLSKGTPKNKAKTTISDCLVDKFKQNEDEIHAFIYAHDDILKNFKDTNCLAIAKAVEEKGKYGQAIELYIKGGHINKAMEIAWKVLEKGDIREATSCFSAAAKYKIPGAKEMYKFIQAASNELGNHIDSKTFN